MKYILKMQKTMKKLSNNYQNGFQVEEAFKKTVKQHLETKNWTVFEEEPSLNKKWRADLIITRPDTEIFIGLELKNNIESCTLTQGMHQILAYQNTFFSVQPSIWAIVTPQCMDWKQQRFFWRLGIGTGFFNTPWKSIQYINADIKDTLWLDDDNPYNQNTVENTKRLAKKIQTEYVIWNVYERNRV